MPTVTSCKDPSGIVSAAVLSLPTCIMKSSPPSSMTTSFPTLITMGGIAPADACSLPAILTKWRFYASHEGLDGSFIVNICSGKWLWKPPVSDWNLEWDIEPIPNPGGTWYHVPGCRQWIQLDCITSWIHRPTDYRWYLVEDTARPLQYACPPFPHQIDFNLAKLTLRWMNHKKGGSVAPCHVILVPAKPVESGCSLSPTHPHPMSYVVAVLSTMGGTASHCRTTFRQQRLTSWPPSRSIGWLANANGLVTTLVVDLGHPIRQMRPFPPTLNQQWGGLQCRLCPIPCWHKQKIGILVCIYLPPFNP